MSVNKCGWPINLAKKVKGRMLAGEKPTDPVDHGPQGTQTSRSRDIIGGSN